MTEPSTHIRRSHDRPGARRRALALTGVAALTGLSGVGLTVALSPGALAAHAKSKVVVKKESRGALGAILVTASGATLYHFTPDKPNKATCTGSCATLWPPLLLPAGTKIARASGLTGLGTIKAARGRLQVTYHQMPLYRYAPDSGTSTSGQGIGGVWFVVHPKGSGSSSGASGTSSGGSSTTTASGGTRY